MLWFVCFAALVSLVYSQESQGGTVAFTKGLTAHATLTKGDIIPFGKDITNINAGFTSDGKFQVQIPGIYGFHFYALSKNDAEIWLEIWKNEDYVVSIYAYTASDWADAGNSVILELQPGDTVYVKATDDYTNAIYGGATEIYTTFSGVLLFSEATAISNPVAFSAALTHNVTLSSGAHVIYDKVFVNAGNAYNTNTGDFSAPVEGIYAIHYHSLAEQGEEMWLDLYHNDNYVNSAFGQAPNTWADAGNSAILELHPGDKINIRSRPGESVVLFGATDQVYTTLNIILLSPTLHAAPTTSPGVGGGVQAFSVGLSRNIDNTQSTSKVVFDRVFTNHGSGYNLVTGKFTAQVAGIYVFYYHALAQQDDEVWLELYHNSKYVNSLYGHATHGWAGGSNTASLELAKGDTVYVDMVDHKKSTIYGGGNEIYSTFSGYLLTPMSSYKPVIGK